MSQPRVTLGTDSGDLRSGLWATIDIHQQLNALWTCKVVLRNTADARPQVEEQLGTILTVSTISLLGVENVIFSGVIRRVRLVYEINGAFGAEVEAVSHAVALTHGPRFAYFKQQSASAVAGTLLGNAGLALSGAMPAGETLSYAQVEETDFDFFARLVDNVEAWFRPALDPGARGLEVQTAFQSGPTLLWREGEYGLLEWRTSGHLAPVTATGSHYDPQAMQSQTFPSIASDAAFSGDAASRMVGAVKAASAGLGTAGVVDRRRTTTNASFQTLLEREARRASASATLCAGSSREPQVRAGDTITLTGMPDDDATYGVIACDHHWTVNGYENRFTAVPATRWSPPVRVAAPPRTGVYPARVLDNYDPHNQGRLQVAYAWQETGQTTWVRMLSPHAGADRGLTFVPEKGDEVLIAFEDADPERAVVVASVWNGAHATPAEGFWKPGEQNQTEFAPNEIRRLVTRSGHRITLVDTPGFETIALATPKGARIVLAEQLNETEGRPGILIQSKGDIILKAGGRIHEQSKYTSRQTGTGLG